MKQVLIAAGGTGGHVFPALAVAEELRERGYQVSWLGTPERLEARVVPAAGYDFYTVPQQALRGRGWRGLLAAPVRLACSIRQCARLLRQLQPDLVLGFGGYTAGPAGVAAWLQRRPLIIHEQNAAPGLTNKLLARIARHTLLGFPVAQSALAGGQVVGNPVRPAIAQLAKEPVKTAEAPFRLLVLGGSLGARRLNQVIPAALAAWQGPPVQVQHQCGAGWQAETAELYQATAVAAEVVEFITDMASAYRQADLVVCRAGALTVSELSCAGVPALLVPYPHAVDDHQYLNAGVLSESGAAIRMRQTEFTPGAVAAWLQKLLAEPAQLQTMGQRAREQASARAAVKIADCCMAEMQESVKS